MKQFCTLILSVAAFSLLNAAPQLRESSQVETDSRFTDPAKARNAYQNSANLWLAYEVPAIADLTSPCCLSGRSNQFSQTGCRLGEKPGIYGSVSGHSVITRHLIIFTQLQAGSVKEILAVGDACPVDVNDQAVVWLDGIHQDASVPWLRSIYKEEWGERLADQAMAALAMHQTTAATAALHQTATAERESLAETAVFWLGQRHQQGLEALTSLLEELPPGDVRRQINFSLSENSSPKAFEALLDISRNDADPEQRGDALFWLAQSGADPQRIISRLTEALQKDPSGDIAERALHALAELETAAARDVLLQTAKSHDSGEIRGQAAFWLVQGYPDIVDKQLLAILVSENDTDVQEQIVFAISQLPKARNGRVLLQLIQGDYGRQVKQQALFWLAQEGGDEALQELENMLLKTARR